MKITDVTAVLPPDRLKAGEASASVVSGAQERVSVDSTKEAEASVAVAQKAAGGRRAARLEKLESQVRSGGYSPNASSVAEQILSDAEVDAKLAALLQR